MNRAGSTRYVPGVRDAKLWIYEARRCGAPALMLPLLSGVAIVVAAVAARMTNAVDARTVGLVTVAVVAAAAVSIAGIATLGEWSHPARGPLAVLVPLGSSLLLIGAGAVAQVLAQSTAAASTIVVGVWLFQLIMIDRIVPVWQVIEPCCWRPVPRW